MPLSASQMHCCTQMLLHGQYASTDDDHNNHNKEKNLKIHGSHYLRMMMIEITQFLHKTETNEHIEHVHSRHD